MGGAGGGLRPIDLARAAGVSTQQIRDYEDAGVLPPVPRTPSGYRRFDAVHREAALTYQALARGHGGDAAQAIMRAVHAGDLPQAYALVDAGHAALHEQRLSLRATGEALQAVAERKPDTSAVPRAGLRIGEAAAHLGVRASALRMWESAGLLVPARDPATGYRLYGPSDVRDARMVILLRQGRHPLPQIRLVLDDLRRTGGAGALGEAIARRGAELALRSAAMIEGSGRLHHYVTARASGNSISRTPERE
ncbi:MerR family transcriptional regulator [Actinomadura rubrisoli]|uniref:MerR family DNA-binding transcriptional regulator n=1 Tax=Actinomadura rubrisoli TaxID=2530368 RepID=A0A4R5AJ61_9ACTN|nr:MerR family transcriptional regulator [Actinomadura rubrisoli]TDD71419.1 MerR family DNA-binding transcriptional regulator [Actinomadura rubrisoli]